MRLSFALLLAAVGSSTATGPSRVLARWMGASGTSIEYDRNRSRCNDDWNPINAGDLRRGIEWLNSLKMEAHLDAGDCFMVMCEGQTAMWWCNDGDHVMFSDWTHLADAGNFFLDFCRVGGQTVRGGQAVPKLYENGQRWQAVLDTWGSCRDFDAIKEKYGPKARR